MREAGERFYTPNEISECGIMSLVKQWQERKAGRLQFYRIGERKVLYGQHHLDAYFALCESDARKAAAREDASKAAAEPAMESKATRRIFQQTEDYQ